MIHSISEPTEPTKPTEPTETTKQPGRTTPTTSRKRKAVASRPTQENATRQTGPAAKKRRCHNNWENTAVFPWLVQNYPKPRPSPEEIIPMSAESGIASITLNRFFDNYGRKGKNERFCSLKQSVEDAAQQASRK